MKKHGTWQIKQSGGRFYLQREVLPRVDKIKWESYEGAYDSSNHEAVKLKQTRLNATYEAQKKKQEERYDFDHAYFSKATVEDFNQQRAHSVTGTHFIRDQHSQLMKAFDFFVLKKGLRNPDEWQEHQFELGKELLRKEYSHHTINKVQVVINQYLKFLSQRFPGEIIGKPVLLIAKAKLKVIKAEAEATERGQYIPPHHFNLIRRYAGDIRPHIELGMAFGARRGEILGLRKEDLYEDSLDISRQLLTCPIDEEPTFGPTKSRKKRSVPYWWMNPDEAHDWISRLKLMHKRTLTQRFEDVIKDINQHEKLSLTYTIHDLRHTFCTNSVRKHNIIDVQRAAGHEDIRTTQNYIEDDRELSRKKFIPKTSST